ncbi:MAG: hypothetical protein V3V01_20825 [Acidimicrobiales bacterium]
MPDIAPPHIGTLNEGSLHAALKRIYSYPGDELEVPLDGFVIDIRRDDLLIEIQTGSFGAMGRKLDRVLGEYRVKLVHPVAVQTWLAKPDVKERRSPKKGTVYSLFDELVSLPTLLDHPNLTLDVVLVTVTKHQIHDPDARRGRGGFRTTDRVLREIIEIERFESVNDLRRLLPDDLPEEFTTADLASLAGVSRSTAQKMAYCFRPMGVFIETGRTRSGIQHRLA